MAERNMEKCVCNDIKDILVSSLIIKCENNRESGYVSDWTHTPKKKDKSKIDSLQGKDTWKGKVWRFINLFNRKQKIETKEVSVKIYECDESSTYASSLSCDCTSCFVDQIQLKDASTSSSISKMDQQTQTDENLNSNDPQDLTSNESFLSTNDFMNFIDEISSVSPISSEIEQCLENYNLGDDFLKFINEINKMPMPKALIKQKKFSDVSIQTKINRLPDLVEKTKMRKKMKKFVDPKNEFMEEYFVVHRKKVEYYETIAHKLDPESQKKSPKFPLVSDPFPNLADEFKKIRFKPVKLPPLETSTLLNLERSRGEELKRTRKPRFCHECRAKYLPNAKYCSNCGIKRIIF